MDCVIDCDEEEKGPDKPIHRWCTGPHFESGGQSLKFQELKA